MLLQLYDKELKEVARHEVDIQPYTYTPNEGYIYT